MADSGVPPAGGAVEVKAMIVPPECQGLAQQIEALEAEKRSLQEGLQGLAGAEKWETLQEIGALKGQITGLRLSLEQCIYMHAPGYKTKVTVLDLVGTSVLPYVGRLWQLVAPSSQNMRETRTVQGGSITFANSTSFPSGSIGVSIHDDPGSIFTGALFRSGPLSVLPPGSPGDPAGLIEIGVPATPPPISSATIGARLPRLPMEVAAVAAPNGMNTVTIEALTLTLGSGSVNLTVGGKAALGAGIFGTVPFPFIYTLTFSIVPSHNMNDVTETCVVAPLGPGTLATTLAGPSALLLSIAMPSIELAIRTSVVAAVQTALNAAILTTAASTIGQATLPPGVVVSMRRVVITPGGMVFFPALGAFGGLLNKIPPP